MSKSYVCAVHDGIQMEQVDFKTVYLVPCSKCGKIIRRRVYDSEKTYLCDYCKLSLNRKKKAKEQEELDKIMTRKEQAFEKAIEKMGKQVDLKEYESSINVARKRVEYYGSIPEAMVAIELLHNGYKIVPQGKIGKYKVDFAIPDKKIVVEVDGGTFHPNGANPKREATIQLSLGIEWKIIHIPADWISKHIKSLNNMINTYMLRH